MAYGKKKAPKGASKKAAKQLNKMAKSAPSKRYGKAVMKEDTRKPGRKMGYATTASTKLPKYNPRKPTTKAGRKSLKK
jgi:hypothetical protein